MPPNDKVFDPEIPVLEIHPKEIIKDVSKMLLSEYSGEYCLKYLYLYENKSLCSSHSFFLEHSFCSKDVIPT